MDTSWVSLEIIQGLYFLLFQSDRLLVAGLSMFTAYSTRTQIIDHLVKNIWKKRFALQTQVDPPMKSHAIMKILSRIVAMIQWESPLVEVETVWRGHGIADSSTQVMGHHWGPWEGLRRGLEMEVSWNRGTPSHHPFFKGCSIIRGIHLGYPHLWKPPYEPMIPWFLWGWTSIYQPGFSPE